jgi:magnesium-transporting ATPase (P-type)
MSPGVSPRRGLCLQACFRAQGPRAAEHEAARGLVCGRAQAAEGGGRLQCDVSRARSVSLPRDPRLMRGLVSGRAQVTEGSGRLLVLAVGERSEWGRTMAMVASEPAPTPLQAALGTLAAAIGKVGLVVGALCFVVLLVRRAPAAPAFSPCGARDRP